MTKKAYVHRMPMSEELSDTNRTNGKARSQPACREPQGRTTATSSPELQIRSQNPRWLTFIGWFAMLSFSFYASTHMVAAGDTWVAMACGRHFVNHGVNTVEPFSDNSHKPGPTPEEVATWPKWAQWITAKVGLETVKKWHPTGWINQNWLTHVMFYEMTTKFPGLGSEQKPYFDALVFWKFAVYILLVICLYSTMRLLGVNRLLAAVFACFAMYIGRSFLDVRPAGFSNLLVAVFLLVLTLTSYRNALYIWLIVPLIVFWANVHGGYIYAFLMLVPFVLWHTIMRLPKRWTIFVYSLLTWAVLCVLANRLLKLDYFKTVPMSRDWVLYLFLVAGAGGAALTYNRRVSEKALVSFHAAVSCILFVLYLTRFFPVTPDELTRYGRQLFDTDVGSARLAFMGIFAFAMLFGTLTVLLGDRVVRVLEPKAILHTIAAGAVAFVAMVLFNPFHLTNLTHTFVISVSKQAERWRDVHEWHRALDWTNPVGTAIPFLVMYILAWLCLLIWVFALVQTGRVSRQSTKKKKTAASEYEWPKIDVVLLAIGAMTVYMAIRSRRFIPIAAYAACPIVALLVQETVRRLLAVVGPGRYEKMAPAVLTNAIAEASRLGITAALAVFGLWCLLLQRWLFVPVPGHSELTQPQVTLTFVGIALAVLAFLASAVWYALVGGYVRAGLRPAPADSAGGIARPAVMTASVLLAGLAIGFGAWVGWKFNEIYLEYWPADSKLTSVFMRMTASDAKPFYACQFIRDNKLQGNMFNYWTEGGFIAWGQTPDPDTGKTPLQLFMDGRAQAAYDVKTFDRWSEIMAGGPVVVQAAREGRTPKVEEYPEIGKWISEELAKHNVWVILMPANQFDSAFVYGIEASPNWRTVFMNNKQKLFVDVRTDAGRRLYEDVVDGKAIFPDEFSADLTRGHNFLLFTDPQKKREGLDLVIKAFQIEPSPAPVLDLLLIASRYPDLREQVDQACLDFATQFDKNKAEYVGHDAFNLRIEAARLCLARLEQVAKAQGKKEEAQEYDARMSRYIAERNKVSDEKRW
jgi:hypothetical protein